MSFWFIAGVLAAVNPCGFVLLPTYLVYFLGLQSAEGKVSQREALRKSLKVAGSLSLGFLAVFVVAATIANFFSTWLTANAKFATGFFGIALLGLGGAMLFGYKLPFMNPQNLQGKKDQTVKSMFVYGAAYAIASLGCTIGFFITAVFSTARSGGAWTGVQNGLAYAAGMSILVGGLTVSLAFANTGLVGLLRKSLQYMDRLAAAFVIISGFYLIWYFYWVDLLNPLDLTWFGEPARDPITTWVENVQADTSSFLNSHQWGVAVLMFSLVASTLAYVYTKSLAVHLGLVGAGFVAAGLLSNDWFAASIIAGTTLVAGLLGLFIDRNHTAVVDESPTEEPAETDADGEPELV